MKTVLITGCSTGFGRETALHFLEQGWRVAATMRDPSASTLPASDRLQVLALDVTDPHSIARAVEATGPIDVLVNNAGVGWLNALEGTPLDTVRHIFEANLFGAIATMQAVLPGMRAQGSGVIVNVASSTIYKPMPMLAVYRASKSALVSLTESVAGELGGFGTRARVVAPGLAPSTQFAANAQGRMSRDVAGPHEAYAAVTERMLGAMQAVAAGEVTTSRHVAEAVYRAATDADCPMVLPAGPDAIAWAAESR